MEKKYVSQAEVLSLLKQKGELTDLENSSIEFIEKFVKIKDAEKFIKDLEKEFGIPVNVATKIADISPETREELTAILASYSLLLDEKKVDGILDRIKQEL